MKTLNPSIAPALQNGLSVLEMLSQAENDMSFSEITRRLGVSNSTTSRLLKILRERNYVIRDGASGRYRAGPRMSTLGQKIPLVDRLRRASHLILEALSEATSNTAMIIYWSGQEMQCLDKVVHQASVPMQEVGTINTDCSANPWGWIFFDALPAVEKKTAGKRIRDFKEFKSSLSALLADYRKTGYCYDNQRVIRHLRRITAPIRNPDGKIIGAVVLGGNPLSISDKQVNEFGCLLVEAAAKLEDHL